MWRAEPRMEPGTHDIGGVNGNEAMVMGKKVDSTSCLKSEAISSWSSACTRDVTLMMHQFAYRPL